MNETIEYSKYMDLLLSLTYCGKYDPCDFVHYIEINVKQPGGVGSAFITQGKLMKRYLNIEVQCLKITYVTFNITFYGVRFMET